jgi:hypothetical protein
MHRVTEVIFATDDHLRKSNEFQKFTLLRRIETPASVEELAFNAFFGCSALAEMLFAADSRIETHLRSVNRRTNPLAYITLVRHPYNNTFAWSGP